MSEGLAMEFLKLAVGAGIDYATPRKKKQGQQKLIDAAINGDLTEVRRLLAKATDSHVPLKDRTCLYRASQECRVVIVVELLKFGYATSLHIASQEGHEGVVVNDQGRCQCKCY